MAKFSELGVESDVIVGKAVEINELFDKRILIENVRIAPTKYPGKNTSGLRMQMQICEAEFNNEPDANGDYFKKDCNGIPTGERRSCFTGSDELMRELHDAENILPQVNRERVRKGQKPITLYPFDTTIIKVGRCFRFT